MKKQIFIFIYALTLFTNYINAQANQQLSNLTTSPAVAVNLSLVPGTNNSIDLGSNTFKWQYVYLGTRALFSQQATDAFIYYNGNKFIHTIGENNQGVYVGELAGNNASGVTEVNNGCVGIGYQALQNLGTGYSGTGNTGVGNHNTAVGWRSLYWLNGNSLTFADKNTMVGSKSGELIGTGKENTGIGWDVFYKNGVMMPPTITGSYNVGVGAAYVLGSLTTGSYNTVVGHGSGIAIMDGNYNTVLGQSAGTTISSGNNNIVIGALQESNLTNYGLNIGGSIYGDLNSDKISIGNSGSLATSSMFNVGTSDQFQINSRGKIPKYGNTAPTNGQILIGSSTSSAMEIATLTEGSAIDITNGAGSIAIDVDINELTAETTIDVDDDYLPFYDESEAANNKMSIETLLAQYASSYRKNRFDYYNEFINGVATVTGGNDIIANNNGSGAGSSATSPSSGGNVVGLVRSQTGTDANGSTSCATSASAVTIGGGAWTYEIRMNQIAVLSDASGGAEIYQLLIGFYDVNTAQNQTDGIYFLYDRAGVSTGSAASANWQTVTTSNSTRTFTTTSSAVSTGATLLKIAINASAGSAEFFINGTSVGTHAANIPAGTNRTTGFGWMLIKSNGTTNRALEMDYLSVQCDYTTPK